MDPTPAPAFRIASWIAARPLLPLGLILLLAATLRGWGMQDAGFGTAYYAAGVLSMGQSWSNFLFNAFDPAGFLALDKPPLAFWPQVLAAKLIGFGPVALHLPQMLEGVAACALLWHLVGRRFGQGAGLLAALILAVTPISVGVDRSNNTDSLLVLTMLLAAWPLMLAAEQGRRRWLLLSAALFGLAFNVKMMAALVVLPAGLLLYLCAAPLRWPRRIADLLLAGLVLLAMALSWPLLVEATPAAGRPYVDSTQGNSVLELAVDHNAIDRFIRPSWLARRRPEPAAPAPAAAPVPGPGAMQAQAVPAGIGRLFDPRMAGQMAWLLPLALAGLVLAWRRRPGFGEGQAALLWGGWAVSCWLVYSAAGGIFMAYYLAPLAPALAALAAIAAVRLRGAWPVGLVLAATAAWQAWLLWSGDAPAALLAAPGLALLLAAGDAMARWLPGLRPAGIAALLLAPLGASLLMLGQPGNTQRPGLRLQAAPARQLQPRDFSRLLAYLEGQRGGARYLLATNTAREAAELILHSGAPVLAFGGYTGLVPILTPEEMAGLVAAGQLRFVLLSGRAQAAAGPPQALADWIRQAGRPVDPALWQPERPEPPAGQGFGRRRGGYGGGGLALYDLARSD